MHTFFKYVTYLDIKALGHYKNKTTIQYAMYEDDKYTDDYDEEEDSEDAEEGFLDEDDLDEDDADDLAEVLADDPELADHHSEDSLGNELGSEADSDEEADDFSD